MPATPLSRALTVLLVLSSVVAISTSDADGWRWVYWVAKPLATFAVLVLAASADRPVSARYRKAVTAGLFLSLVGDVLLMLPVDLFAAGLGAFLLAHLCYLAAFLGESPFLARPVALVGYALVAAALVTAVFRGVPLALRAPVIAYVVVITLMATQAAVWMLEKPSPNAQRAAIGAAWFLVSDATLAIDRFRMDVPYRELVILGTYYLAQWCIARSVERDAPGVPA
ncbi:MAG TPA: lysoplasmalogenase [Casimicrobiaceae bacterium]|nr:lysoplasmalogenase [Casimicrobiaceae bacterium]